MSTRVNVIALKPAALAYMPELLRAAIQYWLTTGELQPGFGQPAAAPAKPRAKRAKAAAPDLSDLRRSLVAEATRKMNAPGILFADSGALLRQLDLVREAVDRRATIPILTTVKIEAQPDGAVTLTGTNLDTTVVAELRAAAVRAPVPWSGEYLLRAEDWQAGKCGPKSVRPWSYRWIAGPAPGLRLTVNAEGLRDVLRRLPKGAPVIIGADGAVICGSATAKLETRDVADFPVLAPTWQTEHVIGAAELAEILGMVGFAISTEETRYYLNGIAFQFDPIGRYGELNEQWLRAVATDGHRLALRRFDARATLGHFPESVIVPRDALRVLGKALARAGGDVTWRFGSHPIDRCAFALAVPDGKITVRTRLIDGTFPDVDRVIPKGTGRHWRVFAGPGVAREDFRSYLAHALDTCFASAKEAETTARHAYKGPAVGSEPAWTVEECGEPAWTVEAAAFAAAVELAASVATDRSRAVKLTVHADKVVIDCRSPEGGSMTAEAACAAELTGGEPFVVGYNARYLLDLCKQAERLTFTTQDAASPALVTVPGDDARLYVQMPMRTKGERS